MLKGVSLRLKKRKNAKASLNFSAGTKSPIDCHNMMVDLNLPGAELYKMVFSYK